MNMVLVALLASGIQVAQGTRDPVTPDTHMYTRFSAPNPPTRPTATRNIPPRSVAPPLGVRRFRGGAQRYIPPR